MTMDKTFDAHAAEPRLYEKWESSGAFKAGAGAKPGAIEDDSPFSRLFENFIDGTDSYRDGRFKLIPRVVKGSWIVKSSVGQTPALMGKKIVQTYHKGPGYFEVDVDVGSSSVAGGILGVVKGYVTSLTIDLAFLLEGQADTELPEAILGAIRFENVSCCLYLEKKRKTDAYAFLFSYR